MKYLFAIAALAALGGCATQQPGPPNYGTRAPTAYQQPSDPHQWHVVSVENVNLPPGAPRPANETTTVLPAPSASQPSVAYQSAPVVVAPAPVYVPAPVIVDPYYEPYYYPPVSLSLGFMFGSGGWHHGGRGWGGVHWTPRGHSRGRR